MKKVTLRLGLSIVAMAGVGLAWACSDTNNGTAAPPSQGNGNNGDAGMTASTGTGTGTGSGSTGPVSATFVPGPIIDDMTGQQSETGGSWYTYSDQSIANSEPPILITGAMGTLSPPLGASFFATQAGDASPLTIADGATFSYRECVGGGQKTWGAGFGMDLTSSVPDGSAVAFNACPTEAGIFDTSPDAGGTGIPLPYDASNYSGFAFWGISLNGKSQSVNIEVDDDQTSPWGGSCNVCLNGGTCPDLAGLEAGSSEGCPCSDSFIQQFTFKPGVWTQFVVKFADFAAFKPADWSKEKVTAFHPETMYNIHFQFATSSPTALAPFDVAVALLQWTM